MIDLNWADLAQIGILLTGILAIVFKLPDPEAMAIREFVAAAVRAAEMIFMSPKSGAEKKAFVEAEVNAKYKIPAKQLDVYIESAVYDLNTNPVKK